jgi:hypothetical protein
MRQCNALIMAAGLMATACIGAAQAADPQPGLKSCAQRDLQLVTLIEQHGDQNTIASDRLAHAYFIVMDARNACRDGRYVEALRIYDSIILEPLLSHRTQ